MSTLSVVMPLIVVLSTYLVAGPPDGASLPFLLLAAWAATIVVAAPAIVRALARVVLPPASDRPAPRPVRPASFRLPTAAGTPGTPRTRAPAAGPGVSA
ncbi:hypothetical protein [Microbacterium marinilacus]|uniref:Uncharacterized protein n=1 Tax=Microbacterium marinilacus TaxID=415209 RepID=A0ABP7BL29_9MICO|nr:hypothetical protein [Microbacterium marinilacus]MBY0688447.1 hypothetical protein [Microbacterium marinilacus]